MRYIIFGNYGNATLALVQWAYQQTLTDVTVVNVDTVWAPDEWMLHVAKAINYVKQCGFKSHTIKVSKSFTELVRERGSFPNQQFQWCPTLLKGIPLLNWLDEEDPSCATTIILGKRRVAARANYQLPEFIEESEHYGERRVWYPLYLHQDADFFSLISQTGFETLPLRSLECDPCIHNTAGDFQRITPTVLKRTAALEQQIGQTMFAKPIAALVADYKELPASAVDSTAGDAFDMGCGSPFACGE